MGKAKQDDVVNPQLPITQLQQISTGFCHSRLSSPTVSPSLFSFKILYVFK